MIIKNEDINKYASKFKTDDEINKMTRQERLKHFYELSVKEMRLYFSTRLTRNAYADLLFAYNVKRRR